MEPRTIITLTALALAALTLEYFTSMFHRGWSALRGARVARSPAPVPTGEAPAPPEAKPAPSMTRATAPPAPVDGIADPADAPRAAEFAGPHVPELRDTSRVADPAPTTRMDAKRDGSNGVAAHVNGGSAPPAPPREPAPAPVQAPVPAAAPTPVATPVPAAALTPEARAEMRVADEIAIISRELTSIETELARDSYLTGIVPALRRLKARAVEYDLDGMMDISDFILNDGVIAYHRDVARTVLELEKLVRDAALIRSLANGPVRLEQGRRVLADDVADEIARGTRLASSLKRHGAGLAQAT